MRRAHVARDPSFATIAELVQARIDLLRGGWLCKCAAALTGLCIDLRRYVVSLRDVGM
jgi:hypothetical protein